MNVATSTPALLRAEGLKKSYRMGREHLTVLRGVDLSVESGKWLAILGQSGSGKSTLLHLLGGLDTPDTGTVHFKGSDLFQMARAHRDQFRNRHVGFVFQSYHLLPELNVIENTLVSAMMQWSAVGWMGQQKRLRDRARQLLQDLGLGDRMKHRPKELSGGERQRVAIARALINEPDVLLADEPTGNLDRATGQRILELFEQLRAKGQTIVMVSHDQAIADRADRILNLEDGRLVAAG